MTSSGVLSLAMLVAADFAVAGSGTARVTAAPSTVSSPAASVTVVAERAVWLIFIDDQHINFEGTKQLRTLLKAISHELIRDGDAFVIRNSGPSSGSTELTTDRERLDTASRSATGNGLKLADALTPQGVNEVRYRAALTRAAACEMIARAQDLDEPSKVFIYIGNGYSFDLTSGGNTSTSAEDPLACEGNGESDQTSRDRPVKLTDMALRAGITMFGIDPRDLPDAPGPDPNVESVVWQSYEAATRNTLRAMAEETGGLTLEPGEELRDFLKSISHAVHC